MYICSERSFTIFFWNASARKGTEMIDWPGGHLKIEQEYCGFAWNHSKLRRFVVLTVKRRVRKINSSTVEVGCIKLRPYVLQFSKVTNHPILHPDSESLQFSLHILAFFASVESFRFRIGTVRHRCDDFHWKWYSPEVHQVEKHVSLSSSGTNSNWEYALTWIYNDKFEFLDLVDFGMWLLQWKLSFMSTPCLAICSLPNCNYAISQTSDVSF